MQVEGGEGAEAVPVELPLTAPGPDGPDEVARIQGWFREFEQLTARKLPLYRHLAGRVADDPEVAARVLLAPPEQRTVPLLFAAVHDVLLAGDGHDLSAWYGSLTDPVRPVGEGEDDPWLHFRELALDDPHVARNLRTRSTQTNEVGRCCALLPALADLARTAPGAPPGGSRPLGLVEVGASAGLNLLFDRYGYRYAPGGPERATGSALVLDCELRGGRALVLPDELPPIASRVGLDLHPVDLGDRAQARWLVACQWPDQPARVHRARIAVALAHGDGPEVLQGDLVDDVAPLVQAVGAFALPVVVATWVLAYLSTERQEAFLAELGRLGAERDLSLVYAELPSRVPGLAVPPRPDGRPDDLPTALVRIDWRDGARRDLRLADLHPHGTWLEWLGDGAGTTRTGQKAVTLREGGRPSTLRSVAASTVRVSPWGVTGHREGNDMTMVRLDLTDVAADEAAELAVLEEENRSLRAYLKRVLELLERHTQEQASAAVVDHPAPGVLDGAEAFERLAGLEDGLGRVEHDLQRVLWLLRGDARPAITSVD
ncbi:DUF2332 family protein [Aquihabitans sp. G128]|uniref:DUF2332 family protein n=1 Tax=Aquihabitans sp. G128 TaxID=2849779 RepID=UPI001C246A5F|nr:DUF2332 family protein [Aquihabitans sp. G128]QXC62975.1 DUF2332 family protein [Aquihabitans sp. G128]